MPFDGSGNFTRSRSWVTEANAGTKIRADNHDNHDGDIANGLSNCITKNGATTLTADIPWSGKHITNLADPVNAQDAATKSFVENFRTFTTSIHLTGSAANGQIYFDAATGANGLSWTMVSPNGMSFAARSGETDKTTARWVFNNNKNADATPTGDVLVIDESGHINNNSGKLTNNLSIDSNGIWRTIVPGFGAMLSYGSGGDFRLSSNDIATITNPYATVALREFFTAQNSIGNSLVTLNKSGPISGVQKYNGIFGQTLGKHRWLIRLGNTAAEGTDRVGSDFDIYAYNNAATTSYLALSIDRSDMKATFGGVVQAPSTFQSGGTTLFLASAPNGQIIFRPNGVASAVEQSYISTTGDMHHSNDLYVGETAPASYGSYLGAGLREKPGVSGGYGDNWINFNGTATSMHVYHGGSDLGLITFQCDYRMKRDVQPLSGMWDKVKNLNPISYMPRKFGPFWDDGAERWGFLAHEMQEKLLPTAAEGEKDAEHQIQSLNLIAVVAALTKALQEAMLRIEALEAA